METKPPSTIRIVLTVEPSDDPFLEIADPVPSQIYEKGVRRRFNGHSVLVHGQTRLEERTLILVENWIGSNRLP
jgi:hypothetical protein